MIKTVSLIIWFFVFALIVPALCQAAELQEIKLPQPRLEGGKPLMQTLAARASSREFTSAELPLQVLGDLLWAADGINRTESGKRTAPSAVNWQNIDIYVALKSGLYLYDVKVHSLKPVLDQDVRAATGKQEFVKDVPLDLVYVADFSKINRGTDEDKNFYSAAHTGFISQNVYLYCASEGLATVVRGMLDRESLAKTMNLRPEQKIIFAQSVGYPKKP
ncbi:MAG: nitroreductase family protein [Candidatus Aminicenantales bacterium]